MRWRRGKALVRPWLWLVRLIGVIVPRRLRADWRQEWEVELWYRETLLSRWDKLAWRTKLDLLWHSLGAFADALWMQPRRLEDEMLQDLRHGVRIALKRRGFTLVAALSLALGIGANTALFSVVDSILLRPLPYACAERLVRIMESNFALKQQWEGWNREGVSLADLREWRSRSRSFEEMAAQMGASFRVTSEGEPVDVVASRVSINLFSFLGAEAALGRAFQPEDEKPGSERVVVLSHSYWVDRYHADPHVLGKKIALGEQRMLGEKIVFDEQPHTIVGVLPASFRDYFNYFARSDRERWAPLSVFARTPTQLWTPIIATPEAVTWYGRGGRRHGWYQVLARLKPGVTLEQAQTEMSAIAERMAQTYPQSNKDVGAALFSLHEEVTQSSRRTMLMLTAMFALILLIACANVASLLLARGIERAKELAIRTALGAGRLRVLRQLLTECLLLASLGGALGLLLAIAMVAGVRPLIPADIPRGDAVTLDYRALLFTLGLTLLTTLLFGLAPAWQTAKINLTEELKEAGRSATESRRSRWLRHALLVGQVALTMVLLAPAGLLINSLVRLYRVDPGYDMRNVASMRVFPPRPHSRERRLQTRPSVEDAEEWKSYWNPLLERVRNLPGVEGAAVTSSSPMQGYGFSSHMGIPGHTPANDRFGPAISGEAVSRDYFRLMKVELLQGRYFTDEDRADTTPVTIVSESFARAYFPQQSAVGQTVALYRGSKMECPATIVGVVADTRVRLDRKIEPHHYLPIAQMPLRGLNLIARTTGNPAEIFDALRGVALSFNPNRPVAKPVTLDELWAGYTIKPRFYLALLGSLAALALLLAATGIYGALFLAVSQRAHEIGIRRALGAQDRDVLKLALRQGMLLAMTGLAIGLLSALALTRFIRGWLFEVNATDPVTFAAVAVALTLVALLACYAPARRAVKVGPLAALRHE